MGVDVYARIELATEWVDVHAVITALAKKVHSAEIKEPTDDELKKYEKERSLEEEKLTRVDLLVHYFKVHKCWKSWAEALGGVKDIGEDDFDNIYEVAIAESENKCEFSPDGFVEIEFKDGRMRTKSEILGWDHCSKGGVDDEEVDDDKFRPSVQHKRSILNLFKFCELDVKLGWVASAGISC